MFSALSRFFTIISVAFIAAFSVLSLWGSQWAIAAGIFVLAIPLVYAYINLARLRKYILADTVENMPLPSGFWEEVFFRLQRLVRNLKQRIRSIEQQHDHFIEAFQASPNGIVMLDESDQIEWCNSIAERFFGLIFKRDVMQRINFLIRRPEFIQYLHKRLFEEPLLLERMGPDGNLSLMLQAFPFGQNRHLLLIQDVTDLQKADAMRRDFVANVSHEMRTPITVLMGFLETVQSLDLKKDQQDQYFDMMMSQAQRMKSLVEDLLTLANLESNALPATNTVIKVETLMALLKNDAEALSSGKHTFKFDVQSPLNILGDEREVLSAFSNLVSNAIRYTPDAGSIQVSWDVNVLGQGEFSVTDTGPGIASEHLSRLTERFYRVDRSRSRDTGGTGLGLAIVKHIASRHQAQLVIESTPGRGSKFLLRFPKDRVEA
ncbi:phosphate regulon sensor histidine kinase PhoR [Polynucleobacter sp. QLW-P1DATA-2]|uniref:phosphate regulon sensor histidine kinase PhoR n=1 Tax=unclassified Polynucleobacter TaxID=2640945 RepID=UPI0008F7F4F6|nr:MULTISPECIES: phosphate regulon sensor histidine kinase PhoR [unclassified Polynucleobacter]OIM98814.1 phosphate regulon sensor histidine kinase PhoR [Polynucleobacter sp. MWH-Tro8-2-5-gr]OIN00647.1 phosphate regulon sensor histidine kinase PhoR [Polynucleobacter sp. QLW-P1DATA-2]QWD75034.1 phosphate regulon sensor histidine kinase PhoR [Polynucleobacter sp. TSB-Sco08W16]